MLRPIVPLLALCALANPELTADAEVLGVERRVKTVFGENQGKVVRIKAAYENGNDSGQVSLRVGTGFFISSDGLLLANASVTDGARRIWIENGDTTYEAAFVAADGETNLALLRVEDQPKGSFEFVPIDGVTHPPIGTFLLSIGCALEFDPAPRIGLVSGLDSNFGKRVFPTAYIRTTIPANPGEGGSPVFDLNGRLLGMIVASLPEVSASYVIPADAIGKIRDDLFLNGEVRYGWIGMEVESQSRGPGDRAPLLVTRITPGGPAEKGGLREGDRILGLDGAPVEGIHGLRHQFFLARVGQFLSVEVERGKETLNLSIRIAPKGE